MSHEANKEAHCCQHHDEKHHKHHEQKFTNEKSLVVLDIKPKDENTDLEQIRDWLLNNIHQDGLSWGESKVEEVAFGIKKLVIGVVVKDKVSVE